MVGSVSLRVPEALANAGGVHALWQIVLVKLHDSERSAVLLVTCWHRERSLGVNKGNSHCLEELHIDKRGWFCPKAKLSEYEREQKVKEDVQLTIIR